MNDGRVYFVKRLLTLVIGALTITLVSHAQSNTFQIEGTLKDESRSPVPFANVALYKQADSTLVTGAVSNDVGHFNFNAQKGNYYLQITFLSYEEKTINNVNLSSDNLNLGEIVMKPSSQILDEVMVQSDKSQMELYLDKRVFNVGKDLTNISGSAADILDKVPSVTVDIDA